MSWTTAHCCVCAKEFKLNVKRKEVARELFCSIECCRTRWNRTHVTRTCEFCKKEFTRPRSVKQARFCSWSCYREAEPPKEQSGIRANFGKYVSPKAGRVHFDSRLELRRMKELDFDASVVTWSRSKHRIPWRDVDGKERTYFPDFDVEYVDGTHVIEEVKGYIDESSRLKIEAGRQYCADRNITYRVLNDRFFDEFESVYEYYENSYGTWSRPTFESVFMQVARHLAERSTCVRLQVGAVFVDAAFTRVLCLGYNGGISGDANECESLLPGACGCIHAEVNAMMKAMEPLNGSFLFITTAPCKACAKLLIARGIQKVIYGKTYRDKAGILYLKKHGVQTVAWSSYVKAQDETFFMNQFSEKFIKPRLPFDEVNNACCSTADAEKAILKT